MNRRLIWLPSLAAAIIFLSVYASSKESRKSPAENRYQAALRKVGHRLLLSDGDEHSRVLPIRQLSSNRYEVHFEKPLSIRPDSIFNIVNSTILHSGLPKEFTTEVRSCKNQEVLYSFVMSAIDSNTIVSCFGRDLPKDCYYVAINFEASAPVLPRNTYAWMAVLVLMLGAWSYFLYTRAKGKTKDKSLQPENKSLPVGRYQFFPDQRYLAFESERTELTDKESKLLHILAMSINHTVDREKLQKEVWENEGVIVTRSLDVFISRLRKKLEKDTTIRLTNVHGKGYKLELVA